MRLQENPFYVLGVTPEHSIAEIDEIKEDKCFEDETRETEYEEARDILSNPRKRLYAEVRWFCEMLTNVFSTIDSLYLVRDGNSLNEISKSIQNIDAIYTKYLNLGTDTLLLFCAINEARKKARIAQIDTKDTVVDALREALIEDFRDAAAKLSGQLSQSNLVEVANSLANDVIRPSVGVFPKKYNEIVRIFIDLYNAQTQNRLEDDCQKILDDVEKAKAAEENLGFLYTAIRNFENIAKPLQIYFRDIGQVNRQKESQAIEMALRSLSLYYNNDKGLPSLSLSITKFCLTVFTEDPEFIKVMQEDKKVLEKLVQDYENRKSKEESRNNISGCGCLTIIVFIIILLCSKCSFGSPNVSKESKPAVSSSVQKDSNTQKNVPAVSKKEGSQNFEQNTDDLWNKALNGYARQKEEIQYVEPPVGSGLVLGVDEMHWVAREQIRIEKMRSLVQTNEGIDELNRRIDNYNARGSHFRYKRNSWQYAKEDVEKHREEIEAEIVQEVIDNGWG